MHGEGVLREMGALCRRIHTHPCCRDDLDPKIEIDVEACWMHVSGEDGYHMIRTDDWGG